MLIGARNLHHFLLKRDIERTELGILDAKAVLLDQRLLPIAVKDRKCVGFFIRSNGPGGLHPLCEEKRDLTIHAVDLLPGLFQVIHSIFLAVCKNIHCPVL